jgi:plasmid stability protein
MTNLTLAIDEDLLRKARIRALERGTSVNAVVRELLEEYVHGRAARDGAIDGLLALSARSKSRRGRRSWTRDELHE